MKKRFHIQTSENPCCGYYCLSTHPFLYGTWQFPGILEQNSTTSQHPLWPVLLGRAPLSKHSFPPWKNPPLHLPSLDRGHEEAAGLSFQPRQLREGPLLTPTLRCKVCLLGLICKKSALWSNAHLKWYVRRQDLETLRSPFSFNIPALFESSAKGKFPAVGSHSPASSLCFEGTLDIWLLLVFATHCCAQEQRLPRHLFCSSRCCDREALHTHSSPAWFLSLLLVAATAGNSWRNSCEATYAGILKVMAFFSLLSQGWMEK